MEEDARLGCQVTVSAGVTNWEIVRVWLDEHAFADCAVNRIAGYGHHDFVECAEYVALGLKGY